MRRIVPQSYVMQDGFKLGLWQTVQRRAYKKGVMPTERIERLEAKSSDGGDTKSGGEVDSGGGNAPESPYCLVIGVLLDPDSSWMSRLVAFGLITTLTIIQMLLCFAFADTSELMAWQGNNGNLYATRA